jgi:hypothetical protein
MGSLLLQLLFQAAFASAKRRRPYQLCCDEFFHLLDTPALGKRFETALTTLRSFSIHLTLVMHYFHQVPGSLREAMLSNCDLMAIFNNSSRNASFFGDFLPELDPDIVRETLRRMGRLPARHEIKGQLIERLQRLPTGTCYWYDRGKPYRAILVNVRNVPPPHKTVGISEKQLESFMAAEGILRGGIAVPKETLRRQIESRAQRLSELTVPVDMGPQPSAGQAPPRSSNRPRLG